MNKIDNRIVDMRFENRQFERGVAESIRTIDNLSKALQLDDASRGLAEVESAANKFSLSGMAGAVDNISRKFSTLGVIGFTVIQDLTRKALGFVSSIGRTVMEPIVSGGIRRAMNIEQAMFMFEGLDMDVEDTMASANEAVLGTAFGLDEAARAAAMFGASGMEAGDEMTSALRAISGVAAMTSSDYSSIADIFTSIAGNGRLMGNDLLQMSTRGLNAAATLAESMGISEAEVRQMVTAGQIDFETFYTAMDEAFGEHATRANETFTGSLSNMRAALARIGAAFAQPSLTRFRDIFNSLTPVINGVNKALTPFVAGWERFSQARVDDITGFLDGIDLEFLETDVSPEIVQTLANVWRGLGQVLGPIRDAFRDIFPPTTASRITEIAVAVREFSERLTLSTENSENLRRTFRGLFAAFDIVWMVVKRVAGIFLNLITSFGEGENSILGFTGSVGDLIVSIRDAIAEGTLLDTVFGWIETAADGVSSAIEPVVNWLTSFIEGASGLVETEGAFEGVTNSLTPLSILGGIMKRAWERVFGILKGIWNFFAPIASTVGGWFSDIGTELAGAFETADWDRILDIINTSFFGGLLVLLRNGLNFNFGLFNTDTLVESVTGVLGSITDTLSEMQSNLKSKTIMNIAIALAVLAASALVLSMIDSGKLTVALTAMATMFAQLMVSITILQKGLAAKNLIYLPIMAASLIQLSVAILILSVALKILSSMSWSEILRGLVALTVMLALLVGVSHGMSKNTKGMVKAAGAMTIMGLAIHILVGAVKKLAEMSWADLAKGMAGLAALFLLIAGFSHIQKSMRGVISSAVGMVILGAAIHILVSAMQKLAGMSWEEIAKGLVGLTGALLGVAIAMRLMPKNMIATAIGLVIVGAALQLISTAMLSFGGMSWEEIARGLVALAGSLLVLAGAMHLMKGTMGGAIAMVIAANAISVLAPALQELGGMSWEEIARGLVMLAGSLLIIAGGLYLMSGALAGAAALLIVAASLRVLLPVIESFSSMSWDEILRGLAMLAGVFLVLGIAGLALSPLVPTLLALGISITMFGVGIALAGVGVLMFATGLTALSVASGAATVALVSMIAAILGLLPMFATQLGLALVALILVLANSAGAIADGVVIIVSAILSALATLIPQLLSTLGLLIVAIIDLIRDVGPDLIALVVDLLVVLVEAIAEAVPSFVSAAIDIIVALLQGLASGLPDIIAAAVDIIVALLQGLAAGIPDIVGAAVELIVAFLEAIADSITDVTAAAVDVIVAFINGISDGLVDIIAAGVDLLTSLLDGIADAISDVAESATNVVTTFITSIGDSATEIVAAGTKALTDFLDGIANSITEVATSATNVVVAFITAIGDSALEIVQAGTDALTDFLDGIADSITDVATSATNVVVAFLDAIGTNTPIIIQAGFDMVIDILEGIENSIGENTERIISAGIGIGKELAAGAMRGFGNHFNPFSGLGRQSVATAALGGLADKNTTRQATSTGRNIGAAVASGTRSSLGIASPSKVFRQFGMWSALGLADGVSDYADVSTGAATEMADENIDIFRGYVDEVENLLGSGDYSSPSITPILDLTEVERAASSIGSMLPREQLDVGLAYSEMSNIAMLDRLTRALSEQADREPQEVVNIEFTQNNTSPAALSTADIYRQTRNQLSEIRRKVGV